MPSRCAVKSAGRFESVCANVGFFDTPAKRFRAGLVGCTSAGGGRRLEDRTCSIGAILDRGAVEIAGGVHDHASSGSTIGVCCTWIPKRSGLNLSKARER